MAADALNMVEFRMSRLILNIHYKLSKVSSVIPISYSPINQRIFSFYHDDFILTKHEATFQAGIRRTGIQPDRDGYDI